MFSRRRSGGLRGTAPPRGFLAEGRPCSTARDSGVVTPKSAARVSAITLTLIQLVACGLVFSKKADPRHENNPNPVPVGGSGTWCRRDLGQLVAYTGQLVAFPPVGGLRTWRVLGALNAVGGPDRFSSRWGSRWGTGGPAVLLHRIIASSLVIEWAGKVEGWVVGRGRVLWLIYTSHHVGGERPDLTWFPPSRDDKNDISGILPTGPPTYPKFT